MSVATSLVEDQPVRISPADTLYEFEESALLARQSRQESNARSYPRRIPLALKRASGLYVEDVEGRRFIDCLAGAGTLALGHNHPVVIEAIQQVLADGLPLHTLDLTTPVKDQFVQDLFGLLPEALAMIAPVQPKPTITASTFLITPICDQPLAAPDPSASPIFIFLIIPATFSPDT